MSIKAVLFDLDGTLLPMDQDVFVKYYFGLLAKKLAPLGYEPDALVKGIWAGTGAMVKNDGSKTNEEAFWATFTALFGEKCRNHEPVFQEFYCNEFSGAKAACGFAAEAAQVIDLVRSRGVRRVLATNPIFPAIATENRIRWAGLQPSDFEFYTTYENSCHCKPNPDYYRDILAKIGLTAPECLMVGNDVGEDMIARDLGMQVFLLTDCIINKPCKDITQYPNGGFAELLVFLNEMLPSA